MSNNDYVTGIKYPKPFDAYAVSLCQSASRYICILSPQLDHAAFDNSALVDAISALARRSFLFQYGDLPAGGGQPVGDGAAGDAGADDDGAALAGRRAAIRASRAEAAGQHGVHSQVEAGKAEDHEVGLPEDPLESPALQ